MWYDYSISAEPRLQKRYKDLVIAHSSVATQTAAGIRGLHSGPAFAATQAAWRFFGNPRITLPQLCEPLVEAARSATGLCAAFLLVALDWSRLDFAGHASKKDRIELQNRHDLGYNLLTALALSDQTGAPLAPVCLELEAADGLHSTRDTNVLPALSSLDGLTPVMAHVQALELGRPIVYIIDREAPCSLSKKRGGAFQTLGFGGAFFSGARP